MGISTLLVVLSLRNGASLPRLRFEFRIRSSLRIGEATKSLTMCLNDGFARCLYLMNGIVSSNAHGATDGALLDCVGISE